MAGKADIKAGSAYVELLLKDSAFVKGLRSAGTKLKNFGTGVAGIGASITAAGAAITAPLAAMVNQFLAAGDELDKMRQRTGISVEALSELGHAAGQSAIDLGTVEKSVIKMQKNLVEAAGGSKQARESIADLGLSVSDLMAMTPDEQFQAIAEKIGAIPDPTQKAAAAMKVFGKSGTQLLPMIEDLSALRKEARDMGFVMSGESAAAAVKLGDMIANVGKTAQFAGISVGSALVKPIQAGVEVIQRIATRGLKWTQQNGELVRTIFKVGAALTIAGAVITGIGLAIAGAGVVLGGLASGFAALGSVLGTVLSPLGLITGALLAGAFVWTRYTEAGQQAFSSIVEALAPLLATVQQTFQGIADAVSAGDLALAGQIAIAGLRLVLIQGLAALATAVGGAAGDVLGSIGSKLLSGDFAGAWQATISAMAEQWYAFSEGVIAAFTAAARAVTDVWLKATSAISDAILEAATKSGILGDAARAVLGYDDRANEAKTRRLQDAARARGNDTVNLSEDGGAQATARTILGGQADAFKARLDALDASRQKLTNDAAVRRQQQTGGGAEQASAAIEAAQAELDALTAKARQAADEAAAASAENKDKATAAVAGAGGIKQEVVGSFSAAALAAGGAGGGPIVSELKAMNGKMEKFVVTGAQTLAELRNGGKLT